ncbi:uncharacterized protein [Amphiura filiformis]|uniref:uncharacterized protein n=1 Tax=Amphiura filiformis TaxID=82378 RepID=UPI003B2217A2
MERMEKSDMIVAIFLLVWSTFSSLVQGIPTSTMPSKEGTTIRPKFSFSDQYAQDLPPPSKDEPIGPHDDKEKQNSMGILESLNNKGSSWYKTTTFVTMTAADNTTSENASTASAEVVANVTGAPGSTVPSYDYNSTLVTIDPNVTMTTEITSFPENASTSAPSNVTTLPLSQKTLMMVSSPIPPTPISTSSPPSLLSTTKSSPTVKPPKMPVTTSSSSIPSFSSSPVTNGTSHPKRQRTRHPAVVFFLLPFLIAGGVALLIFIGSYLRKKIRLDKLRHQLMPLYSFDPQEGEDWETELLTEPRASTQPTVTTTKVTTASNDPPKLRFAPETVEV